MLLDWLRDLGDTDRSVGTNEGTLGFVEQNGGPVGVVSIFEGSNQCRDDSTHGGLLSPASACIENSVSCVQQ